MDWKMVSLTEHQDIDQNNKFGRYKRAKFTVNGSEHTLRISMPDFDAGKTKELVNKEAQKIIDAYSRSGK